MADPSGFISTLPFLVFFLIGWFITFILSLIWPYDDDEQLNNLFIKLILMGLCVGFSIFVIAYSTVEVNCVECSCYDVEEYIGEEYVNVTYCYTTLGNLADTKNAYFEQIGKLAYPFYAFIVLEIMLMIWFLVNGGVLEYLKR